MSLSNNKLALAALAGILSATVITAGQAHAEEAPAAPDASTSAEPGKEKHACKGLNSCAGNSPDGKNACKGQSACATDGSM